MRLYPISQLKEGMVLAKNIYSQDDSVMPVLIENTVLTNHLIKRLGDQGVLEAYVNNNEESLSFFVPKAKPLLTEEMREDAISSLDNFFSIVKLGEESTHISNAVQIVKHLDLVVEHLVDTLSTDQQALVNITDLKSFDEYTYHHSLSVAVLTIAIANNLGFDKEQLTLIGRCALLHDIGKTAIPIDIIQKPAKLTDSEFAVIKRHSSEGYQYLTKCNIGNDVLWQGVLCHHEKMDGSGYPFGFQGEDIPLMSRIISVADVYDALTSNRPYRLPMPPQDALEYIMGNIGTAFDYDIVKAFLKKLELYPVGSFVELSDGQIAVVLNNENAMRPCVKLVNSGEILDLYHDLRYLKLVITRILPDNVLLLRKAQ